MRFGDRQRLWLVIAIFAIIVSLVGYRLCMAHLRPTVISNCYERTRQLRACRGSIYDATGHEMASSIPVWEYRLDPVALTNRVVRPGKKEPRRTREAIVRTIATQLKLDYRDLLKRSRNIRDRYQFLVRSSDRRAHEILNNRHYVAGITTIDCQIRRYLHAPHLAHVIGFVSTAFTGLAGIEQRYNGELSGSPGHVRVLVDANDRDLDDKVIERIEPVAGADIYLTIDHNVQYETEAALAEGLAEYGAARGWAIVMDSRTGAVLAMAVAPAFDPRNYRKTASADLINRAIAYTYEPGSVMKVITASAAIDANFVTPETRFATNRDDPRYYRLPGDGTHVWEPQMSVRDAIVHSSNIVIGKLGFDFGPKRLWNAMCAFGFGQKTGIELPGETRGILADPSKGEGWDLVRRSRVPIGQGVAVTAIQLASAYQAIANDGIRMKPYVVAKVVEAGGVERVTSPKMVSQPISAKTARTMREVMRGVASKEGTARRAAIRGYSVAGKTGTAQKVMPNGKYASNLFHATFCGIVPAGEPRLVVLVTLDFDEPRRYHQGGNSAGPIFRRIAGAALRYYAVQPDRPEELEDGYTDEYDRRVDANAGEEAAD